MTEIHTCDYQCDHPACIRAQRDELAARAEAQAQGSGEVWQPMDTAPKNGAGILALLPESNFPVGVRYHDGGWHVAWDGSRLGEFDQPRKWMRIPDEDEHTAPPSSPVGVEGLVERMRQAPDRLWMADLVGQKISIERMRDILTFALAQQPAPVALSREELDTCRQWFDSVQDTNAGYLIPDDYFLAEKLYRSVGMRVPDSIRRIAAQQGGAE